MQVDNSTFRNEKDFEVNYSISLAFHIVANFDSGNTSFTGLEMPGSNPDVPISIFEMHPDVHSEQREKSSALNALIPVLYE